METFQPQAQAELELSRTIKLITYGRITGLPHIVELRCTRYDGSIVVLAGTSSSDWVLNALSSGEARVRIGETVCQVSVRAGTGADRKEALEAFRRKYGSQVVNQWYRNADMCLRLDPTGPPQTRGAARGENQTLLNFHQWKGQRNSYYNSVQEAFDSASEEYDFTISHNYINTWIRKRSVGELVRLTRPSDVLLEIGCGTGTEAIMVSKHVKGTVATDIAERMLEILRKKVLAKKLEHRVIVARARASEIGTVEGLLPGGKVRVAFSFNGALNCEPRLSQVAQRLAKIIEKNGYFLCSIRNTLCLAEAISHSMVLQLDKMAARKNQPTMVSVGGIDIPSYYYSPGVFAEFFKPYFKVKRIIGLPAFLPPAYLNDYYLRAGRAVRILEKLELALGSHFPFNRLGDQTLFVFQKR
jgi:SAM-dependent methyltransferase